MAAISIPMPIEAFAITSEGKLFPLTNFELVLTAPVGVAPYLKYTGKVEKVLKREDFTGVYILLQGKPSVTRLNGTTSLIPGDTLTITATVPIPR